MNGDISFVRAWPGVDVAVKTELEHLTGWVLREQGRWFESEIDLLPRLLSPGGRFVDVGGNAGVYTLAAAHIVGPSGRTVAFEPAPSAMELLQRGIEKNGFAWVVARAEALSDRPGRAELWLDASTELASLTPGEKKGGHVTVDVTTLDKACAALSLDRIDLLKIDAEGAEEKVVLGGKDAIAASDPVLLYEIKAGTKLDFTLTKRLATMGYGFYRHVPGINVLAPFEPGGYVDPYQLNLFAISPGRAARLAGDGILALAATSPPDVDSSRGARRIERFPYAQWLAADWQGSKDKRLWSLLSLHSFAHDEPDANASVRWSALEKALSIALERLNEGVSVPRLLTAARLGWEVGSRALAVRTLKDAVAALASGDCCELSEPFLCPNPAYDERRPLGPVAGLVFAASLSMLEKLRAFSTFFTGLDHLADLRLFALLGYRDDEMGRRLALVEERARALFEAGP